MTWNYRIIKGHDGILGVHEVYYDGKGRPEGYTKDPFLTGETKKELLEELTMMKNNCEKSPVLSAKEFQDGIEKPQFVEVTPALQKKIDKIEKLLPKTGQK